MKESEIMELKEAKCNSAEIVFCDLDFGSNFRDNAPFSILSHFSQYFKTQILSTGVYPNIFIVVSVF